MAMRNKTIVNAINKMYPVENERYPVAFIVDGDALVTSESESYKAPFKVVSYWHDIPSELYDDFGVAKKLGQWLEKNNLWAEWENAGAVKIIQKEA